MLSSTLRLLVVLSLASAVPTLAGSEGYYGTSGAATFSDTVTAGIVRTLDRGFVRCQKVGKVYRYDCYRQLYQDAVHRTNGRSAYRDAALALAQVQGTLGQILAVNADPTTSTTRQGFRIFKPIKPAAVPGSKVKLTRALDRAETTLLRSSERAGDHFARIAAAIHSQKVLLRSAMLLPFLRLIRTLFA